MESEKRFKTKFGYCTIYPDRIELKRTGIFGGMSDIVSGDNITRSLAIYGIAAIYFSYLAYQDYQNDSPSSYMVFHIAFALLFVGSIIYSRNYSAVPVILRKDIQSINLIKGTKGITRSRFEVTFVNEKGKVKKRLIVMPGIFSNGEAETQKALQLMQNENLI